VHWQTQTQYFKNRNRQLNNKLLNQIKCPVAVYANVFAYNSWEREPLRPGSVEYEMGPTTEAHIQSNGGEGNGAMLVRAILDARRRSFAIVNVVVERDQCLLATPPAPSQAGVPPHPRYVALHPSRRRVASLSPSCTPLFSSKAGWKGGA
jgi:hypothetical protein